jgi:hypothetical protein
MRPTTKKVILAWVAALCIIGLAVGCDEAVSTPENGKAASGVSITSTTVPTGSDGLTIEQRNIKDRLLMDNKVGSIKHLYVLSTVSGQCLFYSTVRGKVTSSGKRLSPTEVVYSDKEMGVNGNEVYLNGRRFVTHEMTQDDGTFGHSIDYLYWWDVQGRYHQLYPSAGTLVQVSDQPLPIKSITINLENVTPSVQ